jgi:DNA-binding transcriptional MocR family regulator
MARVTSTDGGLAQGLARQWAQRIEQGLLLPGGRLPSVRDGARQLGVSAFTIVAAYDRLQALGLIEARHKRGFFVRERPAPLPRQGAARSGQSVLPYDSLTLMRSLMTSDETPSSAHGTLPVSWLDASLIRQALREASGPGHDALLLRYGQPQGDPVLREALAQRMADVGVHASTEQVLTTVGATHALDLIAHTLAQPGDAVLVDDPGWPIEYARLTQAGLRLLPVPRGPNGPDLGVLSRLAQQHRPRLYVTVSVLHNPTGHSLSLAQAHEVLRATENTGAPRCWVVEDDTYAAFAPAHLPRLSALDGLRRTLYVTGYAKVLGAGLRVGCVAGPLEAIERLTERKMVQQLASSPITERALALLLHRGGLRRHAERLNQRLESARTRCRRWADQVGCSFSGVPAGLFGWLETGVDSERLAQALANQGVRAAPECLFHPDRRSGTHLRVNFVGAQSLTFWRALGHQREVLLKGEP